MIEDICPPLRNQLQETLKAKVGVCAREIELVETASGMPSSETRDGEMVDDRFRLKIPLTNQSMIWEIIFNNLYPNCPPDFELNDIDFFYSLSANIEELLPSLNQWDCRNDKALINVITELRSAYLKYQVNILESIDNRCAYEYASLVEEKRVTPEQIEVLVDGNSITFLMRLNVNLPMVSDSPDDYTVALLLRFGASANARHASLYNSRNITEALGSNLDLFRQIKSDESVADFAEEQARYSEEQVKAVVTNREKKRRQFVFEMLKRLGKSVLSFDALEYRNARFLLDSDGFICILEVVLPQHFPSQSPLYRLLSVYSTCTPESPLSQLITKIPYSESWQVVNMVDQALNVIKHKKIAAFQPMSVNRFHITQ